MDEEQRTWQRMHGLSRLAVLQLECGRITREVDEIVRACAEGLGLRGASLINLGRAVTLQHTNADGRTHSCSSAVAVTTGINCEKARRLDEAAADIADGRIDGAHLDAALDDASSVTQRWYVGVLALSVLTASIALQFGAGVSGAVFAAVLELLVASCGVLLNKGRIALLFVVMAQALLGTGVALTAAATDVVTWPAAVAAIAVCWVVLVPQPAVVACAADAVDSEYPAAIARGAAVLMTLVGVAVGVTTFIQMGDRLAPAHLGVGALPALAWPLVIVFSGIGAVANAYANGGGRRLVAPAAVIGMGAGALNLLLSRVLDLEAVVSKSLVAAALGVCAAFAARRLGYPSAVLTLMGITGALLPGDVVYAGIMKEMHHTSGLGDLLQAGIICFGIGAGAAFGAMVSALVQRARGRALTGVPTPTSR